MPENRGIKEAVNTYIVLSAVDVIIISSPLPLAGTDAKSADDGSQNSDCKIDNLLQIDQNHFLLI